MLDNEALDLKARGFKVETISSEALNAKVTSFSLERE